MPRNRSKFPDACSEWTREENVGIILHSSTPFTGECRDSSCRQIRAHRDRFANDPPEKILKLRGGLLVPYMFHPVKSRRERRSSKIRGPYPDLVEYSPVLSGSQTRESSAGTLLVMILRIVSSY